MNMELVTAGGKSIFDLNKAMKAIYDTDGRRKGYAKFSETLGYQTQGDLGPKILVDQPPFPTAIYCK